MSGLKKIRRQLWHSLDMAFVKQWLIVAGVCIPISFLFIRTTHSIFHTHSGLFGRGLEDYVNRTVTAAYNEATGQVIIIG